MKNKELSPTQINAFVMIEACTLCSETDDPEIIRETRRDIAQSIANITFDERQNNTPIFKLTQRMIDECVECSRNYPKTRPLINLASRLLD